MSGNLYATTARELVEREGSVEKALRKAEAARDTAPKGSPSYGFWHAVGAILYAKLPRSGIH